MLRRRAGLFLRLRNSYPTTTTTTTPLRQLHAITRTNPKTTPNINTLCVRCVENRRAYVSAAMAEASAAEVEERIDASVGYPRIGPLEQYDRWVHEGKLRDDSYQRGIVKSLQSLHDQLTTYTPPTVIHPTIASLAPPPPRSLFSKLLGLTPPPPPKTTILATLPRGLYLYGDVGSGKTMLMDMFYTTLPPHITSRTRIHFHNFMQDVHKRLHKLKLTYGPDFDAIPFVGADIAARAAVLCFDEFQCTDVADAMILRRLLECLMSHGVVLVSTSNRHPDGLYVNGIQRASFIPCIEMMKDSLEVINLDSPTDYRKIPRPPSGVYHHPSTGQAAEEHARKWFAYFGDPAQEPQPRSHTIWGRDVRVPQASGRAAWFRFDDLCGSATSAADYLELCRHYRGFVITGVPAMDHKSRDLARRFITFIDAVYESRAKLVLTTAVPLAQLFVSKDDIHDSIDDTHGGDLDSTMRNLMDDLGMDMKSLKKSSIFTGDEERFAFARALSRLVEMGSVQWVEREV